RSRRPLRGVAAARRNMRKQSPFLPARPRREQGRVSFCASRLRAFVLPWSGATAGGYAIADRWILVRPWHARQGGPSRLAPRGWRLLPRRWSAATSAALVEAR